MNPLLTEKENNILVDMILECEDYFSRKGCNDLPLENNSENREMIRAARLWNIKGNKESYKKEYGIEYENDECKDMLNDDKLWTNGGFIFSYLMRDKLQII